MSNSLSAYLPEPAERHLVRTIYQGVRTRCLERGETPEQAETHAALDATSWVRALQDGTLIYLGCEPVVRREDPRTTQYRQMRMGAA